MAVFLFTISGLFAFDAYSLNGSTFEQDSVIIDNWQKSKHPSVFLIEDNSDAFEQLSMRYESSLITACENNMDNAYSNWISMMREVETFAEAKNFDIKGVKMWIKIFWANDGSIDHIAYFLKPNSRNISTTALSKFFKDFANFYKFPVTTQFEYSHYGSASFPIFTLK